MKTSPLRLFVIVTALLAGVASLELRADDLGAVKTRMTQRLSKLDELKAKGLLGENNHGFVELRGHDTAAGDVMAGENRDRGEVYAALAKQTGGTAEQVGKARAKQLAASSAAGVWLQREDGTWYKK